MKKKTIPEIHQMRRESAKFQRGDTAKQRKALVKVFEVKDKIENVNDYNKLYTFADLEKKPLVTIEEFRNTFKNYAITWAWIIWSVVIKIINKMKINEDELFELIKIAKKWMEVHSKMNDEPIEEEQFRNVMINLETDLAIKLINEREETWIIKQDDFLMEYLSKYNNKYLPDLPLKKIEQFWKAMWSEYDEQWHNI